MLLRYPGRACGLDCANFTIGRTANQPAQAGDGSVRSATIMGILLPNK